MDKWKSVILEITRAVCGNPHSTVELITMLILAFFGMILIITKTGKAFKFAMPEIGRTLVVVSLGTILSFLSAAAVKIYLSHRLPSGMIQMAAPIAAVALVLLIILVPIACFMLKSKYFPTVFNLILAIATAAGIILLVGAAAGAISSGGKDFSKVREKTAAENELFNKR